jgi:hypothetical protein
MAKSKIPAIKDLNGYFFMGIRGNHVELVYHDDTDQGLAIGAGLTSLMEEDTKLFDIFSAAFITAMQSKESKSNWEKVKIPQKEKSISKKSNKVPKTPVKAAKRK